VSGDIVNVNPVPCPVLVFYFELVYGADDLYCSPALLTGAGIDIINTINADA
jgi:hypothetical protein